MGAFLVVFLEYLNTLVVMLANDSGGLLISLPTRGTLAFLFWEGLELCGSVVNQNRSKRYNRTHSKKHYLNQ